MKRIIFAAALAAVLSVTAFAKPANYAGVWMLDLKQSKDLPPFYANVQSHKLSIKQDEKTLDVGVDISEAGREQPLHFDFAYSLDGTETKTETQVRTPGGLRSVPTTLKAVAAE